ncbi:MAG: phosphoglucosamine mutase [Actinomycetota bacterium]
MLHFGTDGVRGVALEELTTESVRDLARAVARVLSPSAVIVGRDTRESGEALERAVVDGLAAEGVAVHLLGVAPTPAIAFASERHGHVAIALTASHNPWTDNGVKVFAAGGTKLTDAQQIEIEREWHALSTERPAVALGAVHDATAMVEEYVEHRTGVVGPGSLARMHVVIDCANGAMHDVAPRVLEALGAVVVTMNTEPNGRNINDGCGATVPAPLAARVVSSGADLGIAFDGDGDRLIAVDANGEIVDGDHLIAIAAVDLAERGLLRNKGVAVTVMTNIGFHRAMRDAGVDVVVTPVGDRSVLSALEEHDFVLGGEQSGHIVHRAHATTGDGLLAAVLLLEALKRTSRSLADAATVMSSYPQVLVNIRTNERVSNPAAEIEAEMEACESRLGDDGRILVRASGTEPLVRVMVEAAQDSVALSVAGELASALIARFGGQIEGSR